MRKIFFSFLALAFACSAMAFDSATKDHYYTGNGYGVMGLENGKVAVTTVWVAGGTTEVVIPSSVTVEWDGTAGAEASETFEVEQVGNDSPISVLDYDNNDNNVLNIITKISIDEGPTKVANSAFWGATGLQELTLPASLKEIGDYALQNASALVNIYFNYLGEEDVVLGTDAFYWDTTAEKVLPACQVKVRCPKAESAFKTYGLNCSFYDRTLWEDSYDAGEVAWDNGSHINVTLNRSFAAGKWHTLCVPFSIDAWNLKNVFGDGVEVAYLSNSSLVGNDLTLEFATLNLASDYAQTCAPYLVKPSQNVAAATFSGVYFDNSATTTTSTTNAKFIGSFETKNLTANQYFMGNDNNLYTHAGVEMKGYRAYFEFNGSVPANVRARVVMQPRQTTAIGNVQESEPSTKVIKNGHLYILKNGVRYNAQGQIVK